MPGRSVTVGLSLDIGDYVAELNRAAAATKTFATQAAAAGDRSTQATQKAATQTQSFAAANAASIRRVSTGVGLFGAAVAVGVGAAVKSFADFDQQMSSVAATGQDAKANLGALKDAAIEAGAATKFSATEAAQGEEALAKAGVSAKDVLGGGLKGALDLAAAGNQSVADAAETAATAMTQFGLSGKDVPHIADLMAQAAGSAQGEVSDMAMALKQSGLVAHQFGLSIDDTTTTLALFAKNGLIGSDAGTSFKTMLLSLANPSKQAAATMKSLGINAYDAQGQFVGMASLAQQLHDRLGGLTQAQRQAALATIFGTDAIRSASVLYDQGAAGLQQMSSEMSNFGSAADVAATKMDNLKGDFEQFRGSLETALIGLGEGSNGALRGLVQSATDAVNGFNDLGAGTKQAALIVGASIAAMALGAAGLAKLTVAVAETRAAMAALAISAPGAAAGLRSVAAAAGPAAVALVAVAAGAQALDQLSAKGKSADDLAKSLQSVAAGSQDLSGLYSKGNWADALMGSLTGTLPQAENLGDALKILNAQSNATGWEKFAFSFDHLKESIEPGTQGLEKMQTQVSAVDQALAQMAQGGHADQAFKAVQQLADQSGLSIAQIESQLPQFTAAFRDAASAAGATGSAAASANPAIAAAAASIAAMGSDGAAASRDLSQLAQDIFAVGNAAQNSRDAHIAFEQAIDDATAAAKKNGKTLNDNTQKGRDNASALSQIASRGKAYVQSLIEQGKSTKTVTGATQKARDAFVAAATQMTGSKKKAEALANAYGLIPKDVKSKIRQQGAEDSKRKADQFHNALKGLPKDVQTKVESAFKRGGIDAAYAALHAIDGTTATTYVKTVHVGGAKPSAKAGGGMIHGPGTSTSDSIPAMLSDGEFVIRAAAVKAYGVDNLHAINSMGYRDGGLVGFASGGSVDAAAIMRLIAQLVTPLTSVASAERAAASARAAKAREDRDVAAARARQRRARGRRAQSSARSNLNKQLSEQKAATEKLTEANRNLTDAQNSAADTARSMSDQFAQAFRSTSTDATDWLDVMKTGAKDLAGFTSQIGELRKRGLSETLVQQILGMGSAQGSEAAASVLAGGKSLIAQLNQANSSLTKAADALGYLGTTAPKRKAGGGPVSGPGTGTSDSVPIMASNGEYVVNAAATAANRPLLDSINSGRTVISHSYARPGHYRYGGPVTTGSGISTSDLRSALAGMRIVGEMEMVGSRALISGIAVEVYADQTRRAARAK